jgi:hypothetical protein
MMYNLATNGKGCLFLSYEMSWQEVTRKYQAMFEEDGTEPKNVPLFMPIDMCRTGGTLQFQWLYDIIAHAKEENHIKLVVIDHLHFLLPLRDFKNTSFIVGGIVREIKKIAGQLMIPIILIAHITKTKDVPTWNDLRDSSFISQEADMVLMLYRPKKDKKSMKDVFQEYEDYAILSVELNRKSGKSGTVKLWHNGTRFMAEQEFAEYNNKRHGSFIPL